MIRELLITTSKRQKEFSFWCADNVTCVVTWFGLEAGWQRSPAPPTAEGWYNNLEAYSWQRQKRFLRLLTGVPNVSAHDLRLSTVEHAVGMMWWLHQVVAKFGGKNEVRTQWETPKWPTAFTLTAAARSDSQCEWQVQEPMAAAGCPRGWA